jgi:hypothetical protein
MNIVVSLLILAATTSPGTEAAESWEVDLLKYGATAIVAGIGGIWAYWSWTRKQRIAARLRQQERDAEYVQKMKDADLRGAREAG